MTEPTTSTGPDTLTLPPGYIAALSPDGQIIAIPAAPEPTPAPAPTSEPPVPASPETPTRNLPPIVGQVVVLGSITTLAASGAFWMAATALRTAAPVIPDAITCLKWTVALVAVVVAGVVAAKVRTRRDGATTFSVWHTTRTTTVGNQTVKGRGNHGITNHF